MSAAQDWTTGPAKWAAVALLGCLAASGIGWSILRGQPPAMAAAASAPQPSLAGWRGMSREMEPTRASSVQITEAVAEKPAAPQLVSSGPESKAESQVPAQAVRRIDLNTATASELELLPGIGPALAARILEYRRGNGRFRSVDELDNVKGIGPRTLEKLRPLVRVE